MLSRMREFTPENSAITVGDVFAAFASFCAVLLTGLLLSSKYSAWLSTVIAALKSQVMSTYEGKNPKGQYKEKTVVPEAFLCIPVSYPVLLFFLSQLLKRVSSRSQKHNLFMFVHSSVKSRLQCVQCCF